MRDDTKLFKTMQCLMMGLSSALAAQLTGYLYLSKLIPLTWLNWVVGLVTFIAAIAWIVSYWDLLRSRKTHLHPWMILVCSLAGLVLGVMRCV